MDTFWQMLAALASVATAVVAGAALFVAWRQINEMNRQTTLQSSFEVLRYIFNPELQKARRTVLNALEPNTSTWDEADYLAASQVAASYDLLGLLEEQGFAGTDLFVRSGGSSIVNTWRKLEPFIKEVSLEAKKEYWPASTRMKNKVEKSGWHLDELPGPNSAATFAPAPSASPPPHIDVSAHTVAG